MHGCRLSFQVGMHSLLAVMHHYWLIDLIAAIVFIQMPIELIYLLITAVVS